MALVLVTGAATGLGLAAARELIHSGHDVVLHARTPHRLHGFGILDSAQGSMYGDLADLAHTMQIAEQLNQIGRFDAVIHNAGVLSGPDVFAVNVVAPYVMSALMRPPGRMLVLSSSMHLTGATDLDAFDFSHPAGRRSAYDDSKLLVTALAMALARLRPDLMAHAVDPGWVPTRMGGPGASDDLDEGHRTQVWLATANEHEIKPRTGGYWYHRAPRRPHPAAVDEGFQDALLRRLAAHTDIDLP